jgi:hypothetical protein
MTPSEEVEMHERIREWLSRPHSDCYFSFEQYCREDREGMVDELAQFVAQLAVGQAAPTREAVREEAIRKVYDRWSGWIPYGHGEMLMADLRALAAGEHRAVPEGQFHEPESRTEFNLRYGHEATCCFAQNSGMCDCGKGFGPKLKGSRE